MKAPKLPKPFRLSDGGILRPCIAPLIQSVTVSYLQMLEDPKKTHLRIDLDDWLLEVPQETPIKAQHELQKLNRWINHCCMPPGEYTCKDGTVYMPADAGGDFRISSIGESSSKKPVYNFIFIVTFYSTGVPADYHYYESFTDARLDKVGLIQWRNYVRSYYAIMGNGKGGPLMADKEERKYETTSVQGDLDDPFARDFSCTGERK